MATKKRYFVNDSYYHIFNRGVEKRKVFLKDRDLERFLETIEHCLSDSNRLTRKLMKKNSKLFEAPVGVIAFCLMPNHFHLLLKQNTNSGITTFLSRLSNSYTKYFNTKYDRVGPLFQGAFRSVPIESEEQLLHLSRYIHLNPIVVGLSKAPEDYRWSSIGSYITKSSGSFVNPEAVLGQFGSKEAYLQFVNDQIDYAKSLEELKHLHLD